MVKATKTIHLKPLDAVMQLPTPDGERSIPLFEHGTLLVKMYAPRGEDPQTPHTRDEIYVVVSGSGVFFSGDARRPFRAGDFLFAEAGVPHHFEKFTDDFAVWVMYYGPEGGEINRG